MSCCHTDVKGRCFQRAEPVLLLLPLLWHICLQVWGWKGPGRQIQSTPPALGLGPASAVAVPGAARAACRAAALPWLQQGGDRAAAASAGSSAAHCWATPSNNTTRPRAFFCITALGLGQCCNGFHLSFLLNVACSSAAGHGSVITWVARSLVSWNV